MKKISLISLFLFISPWILNVTYAQVLSLPNGNLMEVRQNTGVWKKFVLPTGLLFFVEIAKAEELTPLEEIKMYAMEMADKWEISYKRFAKLINCESRWNPLAYNPKDTDGYPKFGILQFHKPTFYGAGGKDVWSYEEQLNIGAEMMSDGYWRRWPVCSK